MGTTPTSPQHEFERSTRMPLDAVVRLHFEGTVAYQNGFAANVSASGMYVKHPDPPPVGTRLVFEFTVGSQRKPVQGVGEVVWSRDKYDGPGRPAGAGIRFVDEVFVEESLDLKGEYIRQHHADILVMGDDWQGRFDQYSSLCRVVYLPRTPEVSSSGIMAALRLAS